MLEVNGTGQPAWTTHAEADQLLRQIVADLESDCTAIRRLRERLRMETGTRLIDWIDHITLPEEESLITRLTELGFDSDDSPDGSAWRHPGAIFPTIRLYSRETRRLVLKVDSVTDFAFANSLMDRQQIDGQPLAPLRRGRVAFEAGTELWVLERHGTTALVPLPTDSNIQACVLEYAEAFSLRPRHCESDDLGFEALETVIRRSTRDLGRARTCDLFFEAEREYWQSRNRAARIQKARQDRLGLGWGNHDHHTYRSSRRHFARLIRLFESLGFECRERFYAGEEAGWGAQVLEHPACGITVFADVDLSPEEVATDFAHQPLEETDRLGTIGLWCRLHGEAILEAGMHHLEARFDFDSARAQLENAGIGSMRPFTNLPYLKQAFTAGEIWTVDPQRLEAALAEGVITREQAETFRFSGAIGSHLEILQRDQGFKGFNPAGISEIIEATDPRSHPESVR